MQSQNFDIAHQKAGALDAGKNLGKSRNVTAGEIYFATREW
jgi:hypothetical protein